MPPTIEDERQLFPDVKYVYKIAHAVSEGYCTPDLAKIQQ